MSDIIGTISEATPHGAGKGLKCAKYANCEWQGPDDECRLSTADCRLPKL